LQPSAAVEADIAIGRNVPVSTDGEAQQNDMRPHRCGGRTVVDVASLEVYYARFILRAC
jgi:hypothetical protein